MHRQNLNTVWTQMPAFLQNCFLFRTVDMATSLSYLLDIT